MRNTTLKLLRLRFKLYWNTFKNQSWGKRFTSIFVIIAMLGFGLFLGTLSWFFTWGLSQPEAIAIMQEAGLGLDPAAVLDQIPVVMFTSAFLVALLSNIGSLLQLLYLSGDMEFLLAAPLPPRAVFVSKLAQAVVPTFLLMLVLFMPGLVGLGLPRAYGLAYYVLIPVFLLFYVLSGAGLSSLLVMAIVRVVAPRRAAELLGVIGGLLAFVCSQSGQFAGQVGDTVFTPDRLGSLAGAAVPLTSLWNPLGWPGHALTALGRGDWGPGLLLAALTTALAMFVFGATLLMAEKVYFSGWARVQLGGLRKKRRKSVAGEGAAHRGADSLKGIRALWGWLPAPLLAVILKDARLFRRDVRNLSQLVFPIIMAVIWTVSFFRPGVAANGTPGVGGALILAIFIGWNLEIRFGMGAFSLEGRQWWILKTSPISVRHLLWSKFLSGLVFPVVLGALYLLVAGVYQRITVGLLLYELAAFLLVMMALMGLMLAFGIWGANFEWSNPNQVQGGGMGCLAVLAGLFSMLVMGLVFVGGPFLAGQLGWPGLLGYGASLGLGGLVCTVVGVVPLALAAPRVVHLGEDEVGAGRKKSRKRAGR